VLRPGLAILAIGAGVPGIEGVIKLRGRVGTAPGGFIEFLPDVRHLDRLVNTIVDSTLEQQLGIRISVKADDLTHEFVRNAHGIVRVLAGDCLVGFTVHIGIIAHLGQGDDFVFFLGFPGDEILDFRMIDVQADHFGRASGRTAGFDRAGIAVETLEEAHQAG